MFQKFRISLVSLFISMQIVNPLGAGNSPSQVVDQFLWRIARSNSFDGLMDEYCTEIFLGVGDSFVGHKIHIIAEYSLVSAKHINNREVSICVDLFRIATIDIVNRSTIQFFPKKDTLRIGFKLIRSSNSKWLIDDNLDATHFNLFLGDHIKYLTTLFDFFPKNPEYDVEHEIHEAIYNASIDYFHNDFVYSEPYLNKLSVTELTIARNGIFALHGRSFKSKWLQNYFCEKRWYKVNENYTDSLLTENDKLNIRLIKETENQRALRFQKR